jgi:GDP-L-fucose synthase
MKEILITGGSGFLGRHMVPMLRAQGYAVDAPNSKTLNLCDTLAFEGFKDRVYDEIWHLAAWTRAGTFCDTHRGEQWLVNQQINTNVLEFWARHQPQAKLIAMGTSASYAEAPFTEDRYLAGVPIDAFYAYAMCKRMLLVGLDSLHRQYGLNYLYLVPSTLYGPAYHTDGRHLHFIYDLIRKIIRTQKTGEKAVLWGDGYQTRELMFVDDFVAIALHLNQIVSNEVINMGAGNASTIREFAQIICDQVRCDPQLIEYDVTRNAGIRGKCLSVDKLNQLYPDRIQTPLSKGLIATIEWAMDHLEELNTQAEL